MDDRTVPEVASRSDRIRQARATAVGLVLAYAGFSLIKLTDTVFCTRSDGVARCSWNFVTVVPLGFAAAIALAGAAVGLMTRQGSDTSVDR